MSKCFLCPNPGQSIEQQCGHHYCEYHVIELLSSESPVTCEICRNHFKDLAKQPTVTCHRCRDSDPHLVQTCPEHKHCRNCVQVLQYNPAYVECFNCRQFADPQTQPGHSQCVVCNNRSELSLPCNHKVCRPCYTNFISGVLSQFNTDLHSGKANNQCRSFGCPEGCRESYCVFAAENLKLQFQLDKEQEALLDRYYPYFNGIRCTFVFCDTCQQHTVVASSSQRICIICRAPVR